MLDGKFDEEEHHRFQGGDGDISGSLRVDVLMEQDQGRGGLVNPDEFVGALQHIFGFLMGWRSLEKKNKVNRHEQRWYCDRA